MKINYSVVVYFFISFFFIPFGFLTCVYIFVSTASFPLSSFRYILNK